MKRKIKDLDGTPPKEIYRSIIADYDFKLGICELIDNSIDIWSRRKKKSHLIIDLDFDLQQKKIIFSDNAGGISEKEILLFLSPGRTSNTGTEETIGIFGVGSKRAVVAIAEDIKVTTRQGNGKTLFVEFDEHWLKEEDWNFEIFEIDSINKDTTKIELLGIRQSLTDESIENLKDHISCTYAEFIKSDSIEIKVNGIIITPTFFNLDWAFPPKYKPKQINLELPIEKSKIFIVIEAGLIGEKASSGGEYGIYFYCNDRLIARGLRDFEVGFTKGKAGTDHPSKALARIIVKIKGEAQYMPWNSSKSAINYKHRVYESLRDELIKVVIYFTSLSTRFQGHWPEEVFKYKEGKKEIVEVKSLKEIKNAYNIPLPQVRIKYSETIKQKNRDIGRRKPWAVGLYEGIIAVDTIVKQSLQQKNRFALIMLDSTLEIAFKEYLANEVSPQIGTQRLQNILLNRANVITEIKQRVPQISQSDWARINYYYTMRNNLIHQKATTSVTETEVDEYRKIVQGVLKTLFSLKF